MEDLQGGTLALEHRYDLERHVGDYALYAIYRGTQHPFERPVWIKICEAPAEYKAPELYDRIKRSVVQSTEVDVQRMAEVVDFGDFDKHIPFVVSERVEGAALSDYLETHGTLPPAEALEIVRRIGEVLADAHDSGLVHGGVSPRWITVADEGVLVDHFGLQPTMAEIRAMDGVMMSADVLWSLPPEQFGDDEAELDERCDVWALGALLYWMLSGVHPYFDDPTDTADAILRLRNSTTPPTLEELGVEQQVSEYVERALDPDPDLRFASMRDLLAANPSASTPAETVTSPPPAAVAEKPTVSHGAEAPHGSLGTALAVSLALLVLTNIGWLFYTTWAAPEGEPSVRSLPATGPSVLPVGVQLRTEPEGASVLRVNGGNEEEFGDTPLVLDPKALPENMLPLIIRMRGYQDVRLDVESGTDGHELIVHMAADEEQESGGNE